MAKDKKDSEYTTIIKWYQETEKDMNAALDRHPNDYGLGEAVKIMSSATKKLFEKLAPKAMDSDFDNVKALAQDTLKKAQRAFKEQKRENPGISFTREDGIFPDMIQNFLHKIARYFRKDKPTVADLMEDVAKIVHKHVREEERGYEVRAQMSQQSQIPDRVLVEAKKLGETAMNPDKPSSVPGNVNKPPRRMSL